MLKVGDTLYYQDRYSRNKLILDTKVLAIGRKYARCERGIMVDLKTLRSREDGWTPNQFYTTREALDDSLWVDSNRYAIGDKVKYITDIQKLKQIAEIIDYKEKV